MSIRISRGLLAISIGVILAFGIPAYGGVGVNLVFFSADIGTSNDWTYRAIGLYALGMAVLLVVLAILVLTDSLRIRFRIGARVRLLVAALITSLAILHLAAFTGLIPVPNPEARNLLVNSSVGYALASLVAIGLFALVSILKPSTDRVPRLTP